MSGHGEKMTRKQEAAIVALLTAGTVAEAAAACGVSEATLFRWMQEPAFSEQYGAVRRTILREAVNDLQGAAREAVGTLRRLMSCGAPSVECRAAVAVLDTAMKAAELYDLDRRLAELEAAAPARQGAYR